MQNAKTMATPDQILKSMYVNSTNTSKPANRGLFIGMTKNADPCLDCRSLDNSR